ncbi:alpha-1,3-galactosyltransferase 2-like [Chanos chanos]|uniref:Alpha-1,3-galactosyltransferase 2-like n=1 Tax=Chanos chanos TaxID=29144 RepID=A0A6J2UT05_CHACN|nr:alpha-1,3-galactosyltransferase 2-like [Chanos chanos]
MKCLEKLELPKQISGQRGGLGASLWNTLDTDRTYARMLFLDYSSTLNMIQPMKLIVKLADLGVPTLTCNWILNFLTGRPQVVKMGNKVSAELTVSTGSLQPKTLCPLKEERNDAKQIVKSRSSAISVLSPINTFFSQERYLDSILLSFSDYYHISMFYVTPKQNENSRIDVQTRTNWNAPIMWERMFKPELYDSYHKTHGTTVAMTVFAVGKYLDAYLRKFLISAELHFMVGLPVTYYVFTDVPNDVPVIQLARGRKLKVINIQKYDHWQDISMMRMRSIADLIEMELHNPNQFIFCMDVDQEFVGRFGSEALGDSVALLHAHFYKRRLQEFTYDRNPKSLAFMDEGDFYYHAAIFGGSWQNVKRLTETCYEAIMADKENQVEALWQDESHLNKYFWINKPSKLLSPEYCWDRSIGDRSNIVVERLVWAPKHYSLLRT